MEFSNIVSIAQAEEVQDVVEDVMEAREAVEDVLESEEFEDAKEKIEEVIKSPLLKKLLEKFCTCKKPEAK